jgi:hypothetical protein
MYRRVAFVRTDVSEERIASIIRVIRIDELRTSAVTSNRSTLQRLFLQEPRGATSQKTAFTAVKTSNLALH